ncbi:hypothetical protein [Candidatus Symbiopectobacterium sp. 'North America']|uniref:hypothetical protein n=1 Tax=Candidatus Symbiopectobacterium sp. 'North America' TaxID=2794574 RepID=UPI0018CA4B9D|nr:hypothetical protein [Candidatus Symbiopectobacterium sp. 'North America']
MRRQKNASNVPPKRRTAPAPQMPPVTEQRTRVMRVFCVLALSPFFVKFFHVYFFRLKNTKQLFYNKINGCLIRPAGRWPAAPVRDRRTTLLKEIEEKIKRYNDCQIGALRL